MSVENISIKETIENIKVPKDHLDVIIENAFDITSTP